MARGYEQDSARVWDLPLRLFHWSVVLLMIAAWASADYAEALGDATLKWHRAAGYAILVLCVWRLIWGVAGPEPARFASFVRGPAAALSYGRDLLAGRPRHFLGHNPLGAWMVVALLGVMLAQSVSGLFTAERDGVASGPLSRMVAEGTGSLIRHWHHGLFNRLLLPLIALHIAAALFYTFVKREPLIRAMLTGQKPMRGYEDGGIADSGAQASGARALACLMLAAALTLGPVLLLGGRL